MDIDNLRNLLKKNKYVLIDYTEKFKMDIDFEEITKNKKSEAQVMLKLLPIYQEMDKKLMKNNNLVFLLDISKLIKYNAVLYMMLVKIGELPLERDILYLKSSDNFMWFKIGQVVKDNVIMNFLNQKNKNYECNVCFEEYDLWGNSFSSKGSYCGICDFRTCHKCYIKAKKNDLLDSCFGCRTKQTNKYVVF